MTTSSEPVHQIVGDLAGLAVPIESLVSLPGNPRRNDVGVISRSLARWGQRKPVVVRREGSVVEAGNHTVEAARALGWSHVAAVFVDDDELSATGFALADNRTHDVGTYDAADLAAMIDGLRDEELLLADAGFDLIAIDELTQPLVLDPVTGLSGGGRSSVPLADRFLIPPFSVLDARQGWWQDRKRAWIALGIQSELGRGDAEGGGMADAERGRRLTYVQGDRPDEELDDVSRRILRSGSGTSIFDPVLCELVYRWFCPAGGLVLDPFAGGSVRGIVAARLGRSYVGVELSEVQVAANRAQGADICGAARAADDDDDDDAQPDVTPIGVPSWIVGDSRTDQPDIDADLVFTCPPYADLERYSDDPADLSTMDYGAFLAVYRSIIGAAVDRLTQDRFAVVVVGEARGKDGNYYGLVPDTIRAFVDAGCHLYNEAILVTAAGSLPVRAGRQFAAGRKLGKTHQNVLVFVKGSGRAAADACGLVEVVIGAPDDVGPLDL